MDNNKLKLPEREDFGAFSQTPVVTVTPDLEHDIYISEPLQKDLDLIIEEMKGREELGYLAGHGCIFSGFQGIGKTTLVKKIAQQMNVQKIFSIGKEMSTRGILTQFSAAKKSAEEGDNVFVFIDEIDEFGTKEYAKFGDGLSKITALMKELDGITTFRGKGIYYVFAATNFIENVDDRLLRSGRLEEIIEVPMPNITAREKILEIHKKNKSVNPHKYIIADDTIEFLAREAHGYTPADLRSLIKHSCILTRNGKEKTVSLQYAKKALAGFKPSVKRGLDYFVNPSFGLGSMSGRELYRELFADLLKERCVNCLLYGPRGTGKSTFPEALAYDYKYSYIYVPGSALQECLVGEGTKKIQRLLNRAKMSAPCVILLDEIKGTVTARGTISHKDDETAYLNAVLSKPIDGVFLFATANNPYEINETTLSRFQHKVYMGLPEQDEREEFLKSSLNGNASGLSKTLAQKTEGYSFRDLQNLKSTLNRIEKAYTLPNNNPITNLV